MANKKDEFAQTTLGWHVQSQAPSPYAQQGNVGSNLSNAAIPVAVGQSTIPNAGYGDGTAPQVVKVATPSVPATTVLQANPTHADVIVVLSVGTATITAVKVATAGQTYAQATLEGTGAGTYVIPPDGAIGIAYSGGTPTWTWTD